MSLFIGAIRSTQVFQMKESLARLEEKIIV